MAINFPTSPAVNDTYTYNGQSWLWSGTGWNLRVTPTTLPLTGTRAGLVSVTTGTTSVNVNGYDNIRFTMGASTTLSLTGAQDGQRLVLEFTQDGTGSRVLTLGSMFRFGTDITAVTLSTAANKTDKIGVIYNTTAAKFDVVAYIKGF